MSYRVRFTKEAREDLKRLYAFLLKHDLHAAKNALAAISKSIASLEHFPFNCRKAAADKPFLREMIIPFGAFGYVALYEIEDRETVTILAIRHQREDDYF